MKSRRGFLHRATAVGVSIAYGASAKPTDAQSMPPVEASTMPHPDHAAKPPSDIARAQAASMRRFDPRLSDAELETIARGIDGAAAGSALGGGKHPLRNGEEPVTVFVVNA